MEGKVALAALDRYFPEAALRLSTYLTEANRTTTRIVDWRASQLTQFIDLLTQNAEDLREGYHQKRITKVAWATRNLLELQVWVAYCNLSDSNAKSFNDDAGRDLLEFGQVTQRVSEAYGAGRSVGLDTVIQELVNVAPTRLGIVGIEDDYTKVREAAKALGVDAKYAANFKRLSKYAHPTALAMHSVLPEVIEVEEEIRSEFLTDGMIFATHALAAIREVVLKSFDSTPKLE